MTRHKLNELYFEWMCSMVGYSGLHYQKLLRHLHGIEFIYVMDMDGNRAEDGVNLRYRFGYERNIPDYEIASGLDDCPCSVFEMMVALAMRCEETIMSDPDEGNRTGLWFSEMLESLGLAKMDDHHYNTDYINDITERLLTRQYARDGKGGLFTVPGHHRDMRSVEIWYQMMWYLNDILKR